jgi:hypothetical protein
LLAGSTPVGAEPNAWNDWVRKNSPYGTLVAEDGTIWINIVSGLQGNFAVLAGDLRNAREMGDRYPKYFVQGYFLNNKGVKYRQSETFFQLDCRGKRIRRILAVSRDASGKLLSQYGEETSYSNITPDTPRAEQHRLFCLVPK